MVKVRVYIEGGGDTVAQQAPLRQALSTWIQRAIPEATRRPSVIACGGRRSAYEDFRLGVKANPDALNILLVDSEAPVTAPTRWRHVKQRDGDGWDPPPGTSEDNLHFMAQTMEAWLCADPEALAAYFGQGFRPEKLPQRKDLESEPKADLNDKLKAATTPSRKGTYHKGNHLDLLGHVQPTLVIARCPQAGIFVDTLREHLIGAPRG